MTLPISQDRFDNELLYSLLVDGSNILFRDELAHPALDDERWLAWRHTLILAYLPQANAMLPMSSLHFARASPQDGGRVSVRLPAPAVERLVGAFLPHLLEAAASAGIAPEPLWSEDDAKRAVAAVTRRVAAIASRSRFGF